MLINPAANAIEVLTKLGGADAAVRKADEIDASLAADHHNPRFADLVDPSTGRIRRLVWVGIGLAIVLLIFRNRRSANVDELDLKKGGKVNIRYNHEKNLGYGGNQKTCYMQALEDGADIVVMLHPDYQYSPRLIPAMAGMLLLDGTYDLVLAQAPTADVVITNPR